MLCKIIGHKFHSFLKHKQEFPVSSKMEYSVITEGNMPSNNIQAALAPLSIPGSTYEIRCERCGKEVPDENTTKLEKPR